MTNADEKTHYDGRYIDRLSRCKGSGNISDPYFLFCTTTASDIDWQIPTS